MANIKEQAGQLIREARKAKGFTQKEMVEKLNITEASFNRYETGSANMSLDTIQRVADALGVTMKLTFE